LSVRIRIDRLVVEGLPLSHRDRAALAANVEAELAGALRAGRDGWPRHGTTVRRVVGDPVPVGPPTALGSAVARSIHGTLGPGVAG
jgi:hypothetical protein